MSLFKSGNPTLSEKRFADTAGATQLGTDTMTVSGTLNKFGLLFIMVLAGAFYSWNQYDVSDNAHLMPLILTGAIGGFITALIIIFKKKSDYIMKFIYHCIKRDTFISISINNGPVILGFSVKCILLPNELPYNSYIFSISESGTLNFPHGGPNAVWVYSPSPSTLYFFKKLFNSLNALFKSKFVGLLLFCSFLYLNFIYLFIYCS